MPREVSSTMSGEIDYHIVQPSETDYKRIGDAFVIKDAYYKLDFPITKHSESRASHPLKCYVLFSYPFHHSQQSHEIIS